MTISIRKIANFSGNKIKATSITILLLLSMIASFTLLPTADSHTPAWTNIPTHCFIDSAETVGVGQQMQVIWWLDWIPPNSYGYYGDRWKVTVNIIKPDGTNDTYGPLTSDQLEEDTSHIPQPKQAIIQYRLSSPDKYSQEPILQQALLIKTPM
jgi:hypothetical protein